MNSLNKAEEWVIEEYAQVVNLIAQGRQKGYLTPTWNKKTIKENLLNKIDKLCLSIERLKSELNSL